MNDDQVVFLDSDVIIHFINGGHSDKLCKILPRLAILDKVYNELSKRAGFHYELDNMIRSSNSMIATIPFPSLANNEEMNIEYLKLRSELKGEGESYTLAYVRYTKNAIASSNTLDIVDYCTKNSIPYYTTIQLLEIAYKKKILTAHQCDNFIKNVLAKGSILVPRITNFKEYFEKKYPDE